MQKRHEFLWTDGKIVDAKAGLFPKSALGIDQGSLVLMITDEALEQILRSTMESAGTQRFWQAITQLKREKVNPHRGTKELYGWPITRQKYDRQGGICAICGLEMARDRRKVAGDHINPNLTEEEGLNSPKNCQAVHKKCNEQKGAMSVPEQAKHYGRTMTDIIDHGQD